MSAATALYKLSLGTEYLDVLQVTTIGVITTDIIAETIVVNNNISLPGIGEATWEVPRPTGAGQKLTVNGTGNGFVWA